MANDGETIHNYAFHFNTIKFSLVPKKFLISGYIKYKITDCIVFLKD